MRLGIITVGAEVSYRPQAYVRQVGHVVEVSGGRCRVLWHTREGPFGAQDEHYHKRTWVRTAALTQVVRAGSDPLQEPPF